MNCLNLTEEEMNDILTQVLYEFPLRKIVVNMPSWLKGCEKESELHEKLNDCFRKAGNSVTRISDLQRFTESLLSEKLFSKAVTEGVELGVGCAYIDAGLDNSYFYNILSGITGEEIKNDADLIDILKDFSVIKKKYEKIAAALEQVDSTGYGIVMPSIDELSLEEPEIMRQGSRYGVRLKASAPSIHLMKADIKTEVAPIVGSEKQSEDLIKYLLDGFEDDPSKIWESNIFGKSLDELVNEGLKTKLMHMPNEARMKLQQTLERVINEGCNGLICIIV